MSKMTRIFIVVLFVAFVVQNVIISKYASLLHQAQARAERAFVVADKWEQTAKTWQRVSDNWERVMQVHNEVWHKADTGAP